MTAVEQDQLARKFVDQRPRARALFARARAAIAGGVGHDLRYNDVAPTYITHARGSHKWDVDGNEYIDYGMGNAALLLGHAHPAVFDAVQRAVPNGLHFGNDHPEMVDWAELIQARLPKAERVRFTNSGSESDLFTEQTLVPAIVAAVATAVEVLVDAGYPHAEALLELYLSGEMGDIMHEAAKKGLVGQTALHSPTSRYGTVSRLDRFKTPELRRTMEDVLVGIRDGSFAREWSADQRAGYSDFERYQRQLADSQFAHVERAVLTEVSEAVKPALTV